MRKRLRTEEWPVRKIWNRQYLNLILSRTQYKYHIKTITIFIEPLWLLLYCCYECISVRFWVRLKRYHHSDSATNLNR